MRGGFCSGSTGASGQLGDSRAQGPDDQLRLLRRKKELLRRGYSGGQGTTDKTSWHSDMHGRCDVGVRSRWHLGGSRRSEEHTSELQSRLHLVSRLLLEKKTHTSRLSASPRSL